MPRKPMFHGEITIVARRRPDGYWHATVYDGTPEEGHLPMAHGVALRQSDAVELARRHAMEQCDVPATAILAVNPVFVH